MYTLHDLRAQGSMYTLGRAKLHIIVLRRHLPQAPVVWPGLGFLR